MKYDLLLKDGHVIDPSQGINQKMDVGIRGERIEDLGRDLRANESVSDH